MPAIPQFPSCLAPAVVAAGAVLAVVGPAFAAEESRSPFAVAAAVATPAIAAEPTALDGLELRGVTQVGDEIQVCLVAASDASSRWLTVGVPREGILAVRYDFERGAVLVRLADRERWISMRASSVVALPLVKQADGSIDYGHMRLSSREKAEKAAMQHWELLEVSRLGRRGADGVPRTGTAERRRFVPPDPPDKISPVR